TGKQAVQLAQVEDEIEARGQAVAGVGHAHHQLAAEQAVAGVGRLVGEIKLGGEHRPLRRLDLHVVVAGAPGIERRQDGAEAVAAGLVGEEVAAIAEAGIVVFAALVGVPEIDQRPRHRPAGAREHHAAELDQPAAGAGLGEVGALGRARLEIGPVGLPDGRRVAVVTLRRGSGALGESEMRIGSRERRARKYAQPAHAQLPGYGKRDFENAAAGRLHRLLLWSDQALLDCTPLTRISISSTACLATLSFSGSRARSTTLVFGPCWGSKNG